MENGRLPGNGVPYRHLLADSGVQLMNTINHFRVRRLHQTHRQDVKRREHRDYNQNKERFCFNEVNHRLGIVEQLRFYLIGIAAQIGENSTRNGRSGHSHKAENSEIHSNDARRDRDQMAHYRQKSGKEDTTGFVAGQPSLRFFDLFLALAK